MNAPAELPNPWCWTLEGVAAPWGDRPSLYRHILAHLRPGEPGLAPGGDDLPDQELVEEGQPVHWVPGALDGIFGHHSEGIEPEETAEEVLEALRVLTRKATAERAAALYGLLVDGAAIEYVDYLLSALLADDRLPQDRLREIARWIATEAPDREAVKIGIALLGLFRDTLDRELLLALGRHEELTLYTSVALGNSGEQPARVLWELAHQVSGWGRIQIVERLTGVADPEIAAWLLREGYRNGILYEYTALTCATAGNLAAALRCPKADDALLLGAGEILAALIRGREGPAEGIGEYAEGAEAAELYLGHLRRRSALGLEHLLAVHTILRFVEEDGGEADDPDLGWPARRDALVEHAEAILARPEWPEMVQASLASSDPRTFHRAALAARALGMDVWDLSFDRLRRGEDVWSFTLQTEDLSRIDRVLALAEERLPLEQIASGPEEELGFGKGYRDHSALDVLLQELRRFPGRGWPLLRAALQSPVVSNRNLAAVALAAWGRPAWPPGADFLLRSALSREPNEGTREVLGKVLAGEPLET